MKKLAGLKKVLDGIQNSNGSNQERSSEPPLTQSLRAADFTLAKVGRYGFPYHATCLALDSVQKLIAIGTANGAIRICGKPGVEFHVNHETNASVTLLLFLINEGGLVSVCNDASLHIWSIRQKEPALIHSLNFKERITAIHNPFGSKWLYLGTERGNTYLVHVETLKISGYVISWNHVIDVSCKTHPGPVNAISSNPTDQNKLLLNFESGVCVLWDLRSKKPQLTYKLGEATQYVTCATWHIEGKQFLTGHWDGSISTWTYKNSKKPDERQVPHSTAGRSRKEEKEGVCCPVTKVDWLPAKPGELPVIIFSGGMPYGTKNKDKGLTIMRGRSKTLLLSDYVIDFECLMYTPEGADVPEPQALFVLLNREIVVFDLLETKNPCLPWFPVPYTFDIHESPVTCLQLYSECPNEILSSLHSVPMQKKEIPNQSKHPWPLAGGSEGEISQAASLIITGHADGSIKFWDATSNLLIPCYKLSVSRLFEKLNRQQSVGSDNEYYDDPYAVQHICLCPFGRVLSVVCQSYFVVVFKFSTQENIIETTKLDINFSIEVGQEPAAESPTSNDFPLSESFSPPGDHNSLSGASDQTKSSQASLTNLYHPPLKTIGIKWPYGFQPEIVCQQVAYEPMPNITTVAVSSGYGLMAFGNTIGVAIVDYVQKTTVMVILNQDLGAVGEWTDPTAHSPTNEKDMANGFVEITAPKESGKETKEKDKKSNDKNEKKKERISRMLTADYALGHGGHPKLSKKGSSHSLNSYNGNQEDKEKEKEKKEDPMVNAGSTETLSFAYTYTRKSGNLCCPSMWVGTSQGAIAVITLSVPSIGEQRNIQPVLALCTGTLIDVHNSVIKISHLDQIGNIYLSPFECWKEKDSSNSKKSLQTNTTETSERRFVCVASEKHISVYHLPTLKTFANVEPVIEDAYVVRADTMIIESGNAIGCLTTDGTLKIYCLPTLILLLDVECQFSLADYRLIRTFSLSNGGEAVFLASPTEIQRIAFTKEKEERFVDDHGCLFTMCQVPDAKPKGFFENFFGGAPSPLDREELFGEKSGTSRKVADYVPGSGMSTCRQNLDTAAGAIVKAKMALIERGEKLSELEDRTANMNLKASQFSSASKALADKYQKRKWYQL